MSMLIGAKKMAWELMDNKGVPRHNHSVITRVLICKLSAQVLGMNAAALRCDEFLVLLLTEDALTLRGNVPQHASPFSGLSEEARSTLQAKCEAYMAELDG